MSVMVWLDTRGVDGGPNLLRYSRAGRYDRGVASRARHVSCTRRLPAPAPCEGVPGGQVCGPWEPGGRLWWGCPRHVESGSGRSCCV
jgi:hypothetical protein